MKIWKYIGSHDAVEVAGLGVVENGHTVEVDDPDLSKGLEAQPDNWEHVPAKKKETS